MKVIDHIKKAKSTLFSMEILPPLRGNGVQSIFNILDPLMEFKPPFIDVTYHREEYIYKKRDGGYLEKVSTRKRPGTVGICAAIQNKYKVDAVPHIICGGFSKDETENALIDLSFLGIENVLAIRGDARKTEQAFVPEPDGHTYSVDLVKQVVNMNKGIYIDSITQIADDTNFCIGVAGYPEKQFESPNMKTDLKYLKKKIEAGADYIVTQMFFDNQKYFDFVKECRKTGIKCPIIPGLKPVTIKKQLHDLPTIFNIDLPPDLSEELEKCKTDKEAFEVGIQWTIQQSKELIKFGIPCLHYYTLDGTDAVKLIASAVF
ncbi:MAG: methylenetetrahydrofolate reductase [Bacteroidota bacterium]